jgi:hypothetical protein
LLSESLHRNRSRATSDLEKRPPAERDNGAGIGNKDFKLVPALHEQLKCFFTEDSIYSAEYGIRHSIELFVELDNRYGCCNHRRINVKSWSFTGVSKFRDNCIPDLVSAEKHRLPLKEKPNKKKSYG